MAQPIADICSTVGNGFSECERWLLIGQGWLRLLTVEERDQLLQWLPPSARRVFTYAAGQPEIAEVEKILSRVTIRGCG